ncbi:hypothetical protein B0H11DRAFT_2403940, partial [Mycena galericulata]
SLGDLEAYPSPHNTIITPEYSPGSYDVHPTINICNLHSKVVTKVDTLGTVVPSWPVTPHSSFTMSDSLMHSIWSKYTISPEPGMSTLRDTCVALLNHSLSSSDLVPALAGVAFHPWLAEPLREVIPALKHLLYTATQHREALFDHDHSDFRLATILGLRAEEVAGAWGRLKQKLTSIMKCIEHICKSHPRFCTLHAPSALPSFAGESHCSLYTPASRSSPTSAPRKDFHSRQIDCTVEEFLDNGTFDRAEGVKPAKSCGVERSTATHELYSGPTHRRSGGLGEELAEVREDAADEAMATASEVGVYTGHIEKGVGKTRKECMRRLTEVPLEHQRTRTRALSNLSEIGGVLGAESSSTELERLKESEDEFTTKSREGGSLETFSGTGKGLISVSRCESATHPAIRIEDSGASMNHQGGGGAAVAVNVSAASESDRSERDVDTHSDVDELGAKPGELKGRSGTPDELSKDSREEVPLTSKKSLYSPAPSIPAPGRAHDRANVKAARVLHSTSSATDAAATVCSRKTGAAAHCDSGKDLQDSELRGDLYGNLVLTADSSTKTGGLLTSRAPENSQKSAEHAEPLARTITPALFSNIAPVYSTHSESASTEPGGLQESVGQSTSSSCQSSTRTFGTVASLGSNEAFGSEDPHDVDTFEGEADPRVGSEEHAENSDRFSADLCGRDASTSDPIAALHPRRKEEGLLEGPDQLSSAVREDDTRTFATSTSPGSDIPYPALHSGANACADVDEPGVDTGGLKESRGNGEGPICISGSEGATHPAISIRMEDSGAPMVLRGEHDADTRVDVDEPDAEPGELKESEKLAQSSTNSPSKSVRTVGTFKGIGEDSGVTNPRDTREACAAVDLFIAVRSDRGNCFADTFDGADDPGVLSEGVANEVVATMESVREKGQVLQEEYALTSATSANRVTEISSSILYSSTHACAPTAFYSVFLPAVFSSKVFALVSAIIWTWKVSYLGARSLVGDSTPYRGWEREGIGTGSSSFEAASAGARERI